MNKLPTISSGRIRFCPAVYDSRWFP